MAGKFVASKFGRITRAVIDNSHLRQEAGNLRAAVPLTPGLFCCSPQG